MKKTYIKTGMYDIEINFLDTNITKLIYSKLPIVKKIKFWSNELFFFTGSKIKPEDSASQIVNRGELAYWPRGNACGLTPNEIRLASNCNIWGVTDFNYEKLNNLENNQKIKL